MEKRIVGAERKNYESKTFVKLFCKFNDWDRRRQGERGAFLMELQRAGCRKVLDASMGDGCDSIYLLENGFKVVSNEVDPLFIKEAKENARWKKVKLSVVSFDWRELDKAYSPNSFDAVCLLGNSLTYLFKKADRVRAVSAFKNILKPEGILIIDERNYGYILSERKDILKGNFRYSYNNVYCGRDVKTCPVKISDEKVVMKYENKAGETAFLSLYPFKPWEMTQLLCEAGFRLVSKFSDWKSSYHSEADFYQYVARK